jgi:AcrR family transcriptional regulator
MKKPNKKTAQNQRRKPKQARAIAKYNDILDASARVLSAVGYGNATMSEIHLESGHPYATIYQYFGSKEDIYLAWLERFLDSAIFELATLIKNSPNADLDHHITISVRYSLEQIVLNQPILGQLLNGMSLISSYLVELVEEKSLHWIRQAFGPQIELPHNAQLLENMMTAARAGNGYWLMLMLNTKRKIDIQNESRTVAALIKALLLAG